MTKRILPAVIFISLYSYVAMAQANGNCEQNIGFSMLPNHQLMTCEEKEFDAFTFFTTDKGGNRTELVKEGALTKVSYKWLGEWEKRPSGLQIYRNY